MRNRKIVEYAEDFTSAAGSWAIWEARFSPHQVVTDQQLVVKLTCFTTVLWRLPRTFPLRYFQQL